MFLSPFILVRDLGEVCVLSIYNANLFIHALSIGIVPIVEPTDTVSISSTKRIKAVGGLKLAWFIHQAIRQRCGFLSCIYLFGCFNLGFIGP